MKEKRVRYQLFLPEELSHRFEALAAKPGASKSAILTDALTAWLNRQAASELENRFSQRLDRMSMALGRIERDGHVLLESLALFVRYELMVQAPLPDADEAARAVGLTFAQTLRLVVLPQAFRAVLQPVASALIAMIKNSAIAVGVGVTEMGFMMKKLNNDYPASIYEIFVFFALAYMFLVAIVAVTTAVFERKVRVA